MCLVDTDASPSLKKVTGQSSSSVSHSGGVQVNQQATSLLSHVSSLTNPVLMKFYHQMDDLRLNDMLECLCIYTTDPQLDTSVSSFEDAEQWEEVRYPPASVAPRLHCLTYRKLNSSYPFYQSIVASDGDVNLMETQRLVDGRFRALSIRDTNAVLLQDSTLLRDKSSVGKVRDRLLSLLTDSLRGDRLAAEYLLLTILSRRLASSDTADTEGVLVGMIALQFVLGNSISAPATSDIVQDVLSNLSQVLPRVVKVHADSTTLNATPTSYQPSRDYNSNTMTFSPLRMGLGSVLLIDASKESQTQQTQTGALGFSTVGVALNAIGAKSARAIRTVVAEQKLIVTCGYSDVILRTEAPCVVFTAGTRPTQQFGDETEIITLPLIADAAAVNSTAMEGEDEDDDELVVDLSEAELDALRKYWCSARLIETSMSEPLLKLVEDDYVQARQTDAGITGVDFHRWVNMVRLMAASYGESDISELHWKLVRDLEKNRVSRLPAALATASEAVVDSTGRSGATNRVPFSPNSVANNSAVQM